MKLCCTLVVPTCVLNIKFDAVTSILMTKKVEISCFNFSSGMEYRTASLQILNSNNQTARHFQSNL